MNKPVQMAILVTLAILLNNVCICMAAVPACPAASRETQPRHRDYPAHQQHQRSRGEHACCQVGARSSPSQIRAEGSNRPSRFDSITIAVRVPVTGIRLVAARSALRSKEHSPPSAVSVFIATNTLLI